MAAAQAFGWVSAQVARSAECLALTQVATLTQRLAQM